LFSGSRCIRSVTNHHHNLLAFIGKVLRENDDGADGVSVTQSEFSDGAEDSHESGVADVLSLVVEPE
jgi:hypothetical protein